MLAQEFRWLNVSTINKALRINEDNYTRTRQFLQELVTPHLQRTVDWKVIDPLRPQIRVKMNDIRDRVIVHPGKLLLIFQFLFSYNVSRAW